LIHRGGDMVGKYIKTAYFLLHIPSATISINQPKSRPGSSLTNPTTIKRPHQSLFFVPKTGVSRKIDIHYIPIITISIDFQVYDFCKIVSVKLV
tara:strand:+ start:1027 stop:1308 length:282 start_codon:yes stop_codon:yes gene_type:complete